MIETETKALILGGQNSIIPSDGSVTSISPYAFRGCSGLTSITIPDNVTYIGSSAFSNCDHLLYVKIGNGVTELLTGTFGYCVFLIHVDIPDSVTHIDTGLDALLGGVFTECISLDDETRKKVQQLEDNSGGCLLPGTLITLADGSYKNIEDVKPGDMLLTWDFLTGSFSAKPVVFNDAEEEKEVAVVCITFSDGTTIGIVSEHAFFDMDLGKYVYLDENAMQYLGHRFIKQDESVVTLVDVTITIEYTTCYSPVTYGDLCYYANGLLSIPGGISGLFNLFDVDVSSMTYNDRQMQIDIEEFGGLLTIDDFNGMITEEMFEAFNGQYLGIAVKKGLITWEFIEYLANRYGSLC